MTIERKIDHRGDHGMSVEKKVDSWLLSQRNRKGTARRMGVLCVAGFAGGLVIGYLLSGVWS